MSAWKGSCVWMIKKKFVSKLKKEDLEKVK